MCKTCRLGVAGVSIPGRQSTTEGAGGRRGPLVDAHTTRGRQRGNSFSTAGEAFRDGPKSRRHKSLPSPRSNQ